jgi:hypothetical protein
MGILGVVLWGVFVCTTGLGAFFLILAFLGRVVCNLPDSWLKGMVETGLHLGAVVVPCAILYFLFKEGPGAVGVAADAPIRSIAWNAFLLASNLAFWVYTILDLRKLLWNSNKIEKVSTRSTPLPCRAGLPAVPLRRWNDIHRLNYTELDFHCSDRYPALKGLKIGHLTDFHFGKYCPRSFIRTAVDRILEEEPDLLAITGDFVNFSKYVDESFEALEGVKAPLGVFAVRGNHDFWVDPEAIALGIERLGFQLLHDRTVEIKRGDSSFLVAGIESPWNRSGVPLDFIPKDNDRFKLVLSHTPDEFPRLVSRNPHLVLSGHTHGGQICLPFYGPVLVPSYYGRKYASGVCKRGQSILYVSKGIGCYPPLRTLCQPEATLIRLL